MPTMVHTAVSRHSRQTGSLEASVFHRRLKGVYFITALLWLGVLSRLFYWQVVKGSTLRAEAQDQYQRLLTSTGRRGSIYTADNYLLVGNETVYRVFAEPSLLERTPSELGPVLTELILPEVREYRQASESTVREELSSAVEQKITSRLAQANQKWIALFSPVSAEVKEKIEALDLAGIGFEPYLVRAYPEASLAAQLTGFVGRNEAGEPVGYFGVEGSLDRELKAHQVKKIIEKDALGFHLFGSNLDDKTTTNGRDVVLTIRRDVQTQVESLLKEGVEKYGAKSGEVIVMEPSTGKIVAAAAYPQYDQATFNEYPAELYKHPSFSAGYEPGSTLKTLTIAAGIDAGVITPETQCPQCEGPRQLGRYSIKTWNGEYHPNITMTEALAKSDNTAMVFVAEQLGADRLVSYLRQFGLGEKTYIDIQEDTSPPFPTKWGPVELATASFGQGISVTSMQLVRAVAAIANDGVLMRPMIVSAVRDVQTGETITMQPYRERQAVSAETAQIVTEMMIESAAHGEAQWIASKSFAVAGKTGTSQVAVDGSYDPDKTIASFIGFMPPENPRFIMLVKLVEPSSSVWAAETATPLWYAIATRLQWLLFATPEPTH